MPMTHKWQSNVEYPGRTAEPGLVVVPTVCFVVSTDVFNKILLDGWNELLHLRVYRASMTVEKRVEDACKRG